MTLIYIGSAKLTCMSTLFFKLPWKRQPNLVEAVNPSLHYLQTSPSSVWQLGILLPWDAEAGVAVGFVVGLADGVVVEVAVVGVPAKWE